MPTGVGLHYGPATHPARVPGLSTGRATPYKMPATIERIPRLQVSAAFSHAGPSDGDGWKERRWLMFYDPCRRGMIDMRKRFRGNHPMQNSKELADKQAKSEGQLYAGKPAYQSVKELNGDEVQMDPEKTRGL
ncbi:Mitochondrial protein [Penicillium chermesinum]|nr:Mitochondrial protein [Penicillium chermesinum]